MAPFWHLTKIRRVSSQKDSAFKDRKALTKFGRSFDQRIGKVNKIWQMPTGPKASPIEPSSIAIQPANHRKGN